MVKLIVDSASDYTLEEIKKKELSLVPMEIECQGKNYKDRIDIEPDAFYDLLLESPSLPKTSQPSPGAFLKAYDEWEHEIVVIPIAKELSGTYQSAVLAKEMSERENIEVLDSKQVTLSLRLLVEEAIRLRDEGKNAKEIKKELDALKERTHLLAIVDTLEYLYKGGRLSKAAYMAGNFLKIKPIISVIDGKVEVISKARSKKTILSEITKQLEEQGADLSNVYFGYTGKTHDISWFTDALASKFSLQDPTIYQVGAAIGTHAGPGAIAIAYAAKSN
ncbi:DegV family protein [Dubosiella newyorkensis]|jgi:DegV family protein with EDD domain|uniref:EDD domain protein n=3 Tax=Dubosiella newyorkensis TaxID=1862672 RepID=A0A1U7NLJ5_9FIRM|nr:DegV family protein [Dubosiella newyorkensis]MCI9040519.1 DegV family protein [Dubosiella newyorkensis]OLU45598.1 hypothetical protein BO225_08100 [Dubosiella newyorkensis]